MFSDGSTARFSLDGLPCPGLAEDLLTGLAGLIHPHGRVDAAGTVSAYVRAFREMTRQAGRGRVHRAGRRPAQAGPDRVLDGTPRGPRESCTRRVLEAFARGRRASWIPRWPSWRRAGTSTRSPTIRPLPPYREAEWERLTAACAAIADTAFAAHKEALAAAARGSSPGQGPAGPGRTSRWLLARTGPAGAARFGQLTGCSIRAVRRRTGFQEASADLFPTLDVVIAYRLLFGIYSGIVPDGIDDLAVSDIDWAGDAVGPAVLRQGPHRRGEPEPAPPGGAAARAVARPFGAAAQPRRPGRPGRLWLGTSRPGGSALIRQVGRVAIRRWVQRHDVTSDDGGPLKIHRSRIRTTHLSLRDQSAWAGRGRAAIDPNHSPQVEGDHYLTATTPTQQHAIDAIVADAQHDLIRRAHPPAVLTDDDAAVLARELSPAGHLARPGRQRASPNSSAGPATCSPRPAPISCPACTGRRAVPARPGRGSACSARWRSSPRGTP